jgi:FdhD protein
MNTAPAALREVWVCSVEPSGSTHYPDQVAEEVPVALVYNGLSQAVMLATPWQLDELALGFSLSEGIIESPNDIYDLEIRPSCAGIEVNMEIASRQFVRLKDRRRTLAGRTGCGLCGVDSLEALAQRPVFPVPCNVVPNAEAIQSALHAFRNQQALHQLCGGLHGVAWVHLNGEIVTVREDVGRHNALDKLLGWLIHRDENLNHGFILTSSRASYEMVQKTASQKISTLVAVSAPTALAIDCAKRLNINLIGFARPGRMVIYHSQINATSV